jgi:hypothetical protein
MAAMRHRHLIVLLSAAATALPGVVTHGGVVEVILSEAPGDPTAAVPGALDPDGNPVEAEFRSLEVLSVSPDGAQWIIKGRSLLPTDHDTLLILGAGTTPSMLAQEAQPVHDGAPGEVYDFFGSSPPHFNEVGQFVYTARARGGDPATKQKGIFFDGADFHVVRRESDPALDLIDLPPNPSGDELFGNSFGSFHVLNDGTIGSHDQTIKNIHSSRRPAIFYDDTMFAQVNVTAIEESLWDGLNLQGFWTTPDGAHWIARGDDLEPEDVDDILVRDDEVVLREGTAIRGSGIVIGDEGITHTKLLPNGDWFSRGIDSVGGRWAVRNGTVVAATGDPITPGATEHWADVFVSFTGNTAGDWVLAGRTDVGDPCIDDVVVLNGTTVIAREGEPVDLDGNGVLDDDAFIGRSSDTASAFRANMIFLGDDLTFLVIGNLRNSEGDDLDAAGTGGDALLRLRLGCPADIDGDGVVGFEDLLVVLASWGPCACAADIDGDGEVGFPDLLIVLAEWGECGSS